MSGKKNKQSIRWKTNFRFAYRTNIIYLVHISDFSRREQERKYNKWTGEQRTSWNRMCLKYKFSLNTKRTCKRIRSIAISNFLFYVPFWTSKKAQFCVCRNRNYTFCRMCRNWMLLESAKKSTKTIYDGNRQTNRIELNFSETRRTKEIKTKC